MGHATMHRRGSSSRRRPTGRTIPASGLSATCPVSCFRPWSARRGSALPGGVGGRAPSPRLRVARSAARGTGEPAASSGPRPGEGTSDERDRADPVRGRVGASSGEPETGVGRRASGCSAPRRMRNPDLRAIVPHPMQHDGEAAGDGHDGALHAASPGNLHAPGLQPALRLRLAEHHRGRPERGGADAPVAGGSNRADHVAFARLLAPGCQAEMLSDTPRRPEPCRPSASRRSVLIGMAFRAPFT